MRWKLISWNCCLPPWSFTRSHRLPHIVATVLKENPDLICLQEIFLERDRQYLIKRFYKEGFEHSYSFQDLLLVSKHYFTSSYAAKFKVQGKKLSLAILDALYGKAFQVVSIQIGSNKPVITNTHLLSAYALSGRQYQNTRLSQVNEITSYLSTTANQDLVIVGDFNFIPGTEPYKSVEGLGYIDLSHQIPKTTTKKLDYIFAKDLSLEVVALNTKFTKFSDHALLTLELETEK